MYDTGVNIEVNLKGIAERRTDIFGVGGEEAEIGKKVKFKRYMIINQQKVCQCRTQCLVEMLYVYKRRQRDVNSSCFLGKQRFT